MPAAAARNINLISEFARWDDLIYSCFGTKLEEEAYKIIHHQLALDTECKTPSLLAKWLPSENASSKTTKEMANKVRQHLGMTHKEYRKVLSVLRSRINIVEKLMSENRWDEIEFDKLPSKAGLVYKNAFARRDIIAKKYETFIKDEKTAVNADALYPYEIVAKAIRCHCNDEVERAALEKYWNNQKDYLNGKPCKIMCVCDTSGSMTCGGGKTARPIDVAIALSMYCAERISGDYKNKYISFSSRPQFIDIKGVDFVDKVDRIYKTNLCQNTNIEATFDLLLDACKDSAPEDRPEKLIIISDMQIDYMTYNDFTENNAELEMEKIRAKWNAANIKCPDLIYWNVNSFNDTILDRGPHCSFVSGASPVLFEQIMKGVSGIELMLDKLLSERYAAVK